jgi:spermidine synthase
MFAVLSGLLSGALEGDLFKRISFVIEVHPGATMSFVSFWAILAIFLASALVHRLPRLSLTHIKISFVLALAYFAVAAHYIDAIMGFIDTRFMMIADSVIREPFNTFAFPDNLSELLVFVGVLVFPPYLLLSLMLPYVCIRMQIQRLNIGYVYGLNTLAFCIGLIGFTLLAPKVNIFYSLKLFTLLFTVAVAFLLMIRENNRLMLWQPAGFLIAFSAVAIFTPTSFDVNYFPPNTQPAVDPIRALKSNSANTTFVVGEGENSALYFGRMRMSATNIRGRTYMRLMAHFPLLLHPRPEKALLICFGAGNTAAAIAAHDDIRRIDIVDLNDKVFETAPEFAETNDQVYLDPRVRLIHDDGRNFLNITDQTYDLITSEPPPLAAGVYRLYSREYYEAALNHLSPDGLMTQWLPAYLMNPEVVDLAISTFLDVFPHTLIFTGFATDFILLGSRAPIDPSLLEKRFFESERVVNDLAKTHIDGPISLIARIVASDGELRNRYAGKPLIRDQHNDLEHLFRDRARPAIIWYEPKNVLRYVKRTAPGIYADLEPLLMHLGRLRYHVREFPFETLATVRFGDKSDVALADIDWVQIGRLYELLGKAIDAGRRDQAIDVLDQLLEITEEQPEVLLALADFRLREGQYDAAMPSLRQFQQLEPEEFIGHHLLGRALMLAGRADEAVPQFRKAIQLDPAAHAPRFRLAWILATHPDRSRRAPRDAIRLAETAAELTRHENAEVLETLAAAYASAGQYERAAEVAQTTIDTFDSNANDSLLGALRIHQQAYRNGQSLLDQSLQQTQTWE